MLENPMIEERTPREPQYAPCYAEIELSTQAQRDATNAAMAEKLKKELAKGERIARTA